MGFLGGSVSLSANTGDIGDAISIPGSERSLGVGHGNPLQCSCLGNPTDRGAWQATVHRVAKGQTWLKRQGTHRHSSKARRVTTTLCYLCKCIPQIFSHSVAVVD